MEFAVAPYRDLLAQLGERLFIGKKIAAALRWRTTSLWYVKTSRPLCPLAQ